jgi:hypothetical protein
VARDYIASLQADVFPHMTRLADEFVLAPAIRMAINWRVTTIHADGCEPMRSEHSVSATVEMPNLERRLSFTKDSPGLLLLGAAKRARSPWLITKEKERKT